MLLLILTLLATACLCLGASLLPARLRRRPFSPRQLAPGAVVWGGLWLAAALVFAKPGLTTGFDAFGSLFSVPRQAGLPPACWGPGCCVWPGAAGTVPPWRRCWR